MPTIWVDVHDDGRTVEMVLAEPAKALRKLLDLAREFDLCVELAGEMGEYEKPCVCDEVPYMALDTDATSETMDGETVDLSVSSRPDVFCSKCHRQYQPISEDE